MGKGQELFEKWKTAYKKQKELQGTLSQTTDLKQRQSLEDEVQEQGEVILRTIVPFLKPYAFDRILGTNTPEEKLMIQALTTADDGLTNEMKENKAVMESRAIVREFFGYLLREEFGHGNENDFSDQLISLADGFFRSEDQLKKAGTTKNELGRIITFCTHLSSFLGNQLGITKERAKKIYNHINVETGEPGDFKRRNRVNVQVTGLEPETRIEGMEKALKILDRKEQEAEQLLKEGKQSRPYVPILPENPRDFTREVLRNLISKAALPLNDTDAISEISVLLELGWKDLLNQCGHIENVDRNDLTKEQQSEQRPLWHSVQQSSEENYSELLQEIAWRKSRIDKLSELKGKYPKYKSQFSTMIKADEWLNKLKMVQAFRNEKIPFAIDEQMNHLFKMYLDPLPRLYLHYTNSFEQLNNLGETLVGMFHETYLKMTKLAEEKLPSNSSIKTEDNKEQNTPNDSASTIFDKDAITRIESAVTALKQKLMDNKNPVDLASVVGDYRNCVDALIESQFKDSFAEGPGVPILTNSFSFNSSDGSNVPNPPQTLEEQIEVLSRVMKEKILDLDQDEFNGQITSGKAFAPNETVGNPNQLPQYGKVLKGSLQDLYDYGQRIWKRNKMKQYAQKAEPLREDLVEEFKKTNNEKAPNEFEAEEIRKIALWQVMTQSEDMKRYFEAHKIVGSASLLCRYCPKNLQYGTQIMGITCKGLERWRASMQSWIKGLENQARMLMLPQTAPQMQQQMPTLQDRVKGLKDKLGTLPTMSQTEQVDQLRQMQMDCQKMQEEIVTQMRMMQMMMQMQMQMQMKVNNGQQTVRPVAPVSTGAGNPGQNSNNGTVLEAFVGTSIKKAAGNCKIEQAGSLQIGGSEGLATGAAKACVPASTAALPSPFKSIRRKYLLKKGERKEFERKKIEREKPVPPPEGAKTYSGERLQSAPCQISFAVLNSKEQVKHVNPVAPQSSLASTIKGERPSSEEMSMRNQERAEEKTQTKEEKRFSPLDTVTTATLLPYPSKHESSSSENNCKKYLEENEKSSKSSIRRRYLTSYYEKHSRYPVGGFSHPDQSFLSQRSKK